MKSTHLKCVVLARKLFNRIIMERINHTRVFSSQLLAFTILFSILFTALCRADVYVTVYCDDNYPPYSYEESRKAKGLYVEILERAFSLMSGYKISIQPVPWKRGLKLLESGEGFALFPPYLHLKERPYIWPYSEPILKEEVVVMCREEVLSKISGTKWPEDYFGLKIGRNAGFFLGGDHFHQAVKNQQIILDETRGNRENILKVGLGRTDCYINDRLSILSELKKLKDQGIYDEGGKHATLSEGTLISSEIGYLGFTKIDKGKFPFKDDFIKKFNEIINNMKKTGELDNIVKKYTESFDNNHNLN